MDFIRLSVPGFILLLVTELLVARHRGVRAYRFSDTVSNLASGVGSQLTGILSLALTAVVYESVRRRFAIADLSSSPVLAWAVALVGVDFLYYWWHRASHRINFFWATHSVHHQSEEYNLSVALRQSWFAAFFSWVFYLPLPLLGVPYEIFVGSAALSLLYQYWIHTRLIGRLGPFEWIFNTPSHHRVHHGSNRGYLDKNYAATLIVWDRLFGTFAEEKGPVVFGVVHPLRRWSPVVANVRPWLELARNARRQPRRRDRWLYWWREPGWGEGTPPDTAGRAAWPGPERTRSERMIAAAGLAAVTAAGVWLLSLRPVLSTSVAATAGLVLVALLVPIGRLLDSER